MLTNSLTAVLSPILSEILGNDTDVIRSITNLAYEMRPSYAKTYDSGVDVASVVSANGKSLVNQNAGVFFDFDATAFDGAGGFVSTGSTSSLVGDTGITPTSGMFLGFVVEVPASFAFSGLFGLGSGSTVPSTQARMFIQGTSHGSFPGRLGYGVHEDTGIRYLTTLGDQSDSRLAILLNYRDSSNLDIYVNNASSPALTLDPRDAYQFQTNIGFSGADSGIIFGGCFCKIGAHDAVNDPSLADIMAAFKTDYGIA